MRSDHGDGRFVHFDKNNPQKDHQLIQTPHKDSKSPNAASVCPPGTEHAHNPLWKYASSPIVLAQDQTRMGYKHFETSEPFETITGKRQISPPTIHLVSLFAPKASSPADQQNGRQSRHIRDGHEHGQHAELATSSCTLTDSGCVKPTGHQPRS